MPENGVELTPNKLLLTTEEIIKLSSIFIKFGVDKIKLTGGEPTIRKDLIDILKSLNELKPLGLNNIGITTNAIALRSKLPGLVNAGLDSINISLDTLDPFKYEIITRRPGLKKVLESIIEASEIKSLKVKINCVVIRGINEVEILDFIDYFQSYNVVIRFIEYMPFDGRTTFLLLGNQWNHKKLVPYSELLDAIKSRYSRVVKIKDCNNDTTRHYKIEDFKCTVGFIASMTAPFCGSCDRLRLTADGNLKVCLFGNKETNLRDLIRNNVKEGELMEIISTEIKLKKFQHDGIDQLHLNRNRPMVKIGGQNFGLNAIRFMSTKILSHVDKKTGKAKMVDISFKSQSKRNSTASGRVELTKEVIHQIKNNLNKKGDVLSIAEIAGVMASKQTSNLIPLCHPISITSSSVSCSLNENNDCVDILANVKANDCTGVEMEALMAVSVAALTIVDMCKSLGLKIVIKDIMVVSKTGGKSDYILEKE